MEILDNDVMNAIADFDRDIMQDEMEQEDYCRFLTLQEMNGLFDEIWGG